MIRIISFSDVNVLAIILAAVSNSALGALWYSPVLFSKIWMKHIGKKPEDINMNTAKTGYLFTILASLVSSYVLSLLIHMIPSYSIGSGALVGFLAGFGIAAMRELSPTIFEDRDPILYYISAGYHIVSLTIMGMIIAAF